MKPEASKLYWTVRESFENLQNDLEELERQVNKGDDVVDTAFACRETLRFLEDIRKDIDKLRKKAVKIACVIWVKQGGDEPLRTPYCTGTPRVKMIAKLPHPRKDPEEYNKLMEHLGIPSGSGDLVRPHWPNVMEHLTQLGESGKPLPAGIDLNATYPDYEITFRKNKSIPKEVDNGKEE